MASTCAVGLLEACFGNHSIFQRLIFPSAKQIFNNKSHTASERYYFNTIPFKRLPKTIFLLTEIAAFIKII